MSELQPTYKKALLDSRDAFDVKYQALMLEKMSIILCKYEIDENSRLAEVLKVAMRKLILGADMKVGAFSDWFDAHADNTEGILSAPNEVYPYTLSRMYRIVNRAAPTEELYKLLNVERGRYSIIGHTAQLIEDNRQDIGTNDGANKLLGSLIKQAIRVHFLADTDRGVLMDVARDYDCVLQALEDACDQTRYALSCEAQISASL